MKSEDDPALSQLTPEEFARLQESFVEMNSAGSEPGSADDPQSQSWYESLVVKLADALQGAIGSVADEFTDGGHLPPELPEMPAHVLTVDEWIQQRFGEREVDDKERDLAVREHRMAVSQAIREGLFVAPEVIQSHPALWRQTEEQYIVERQRQSEWEVVDEDEIDVVEDLDAPESPLEMRSEIPEGRHSAAFVNVLNPDAIEDVADIEKPVKTDQRRPKPAVASEQSTEPPHYENEPRIQPTVTASAPISDDILAAMFGSGGNPWVMPSTQEAIESPQASAVSIEFPAHLTPEEVDDRRKRRSRFVRDEDSSNPVDDPDNWVSHKRGSWTRRSDTMLTDTPITHPDNWEHFNGQWQRRVEVPPTRVGSVLWQMEQEEAAMAATKRASELDMPLPEDVINLDLPDSTEELPASSSPHEEPRPSRTHRAAQPTLSADEMAEAFDVPPSGDIRPPSDAPRSPASESENEWQGNAVIEDLRRTSREIGEGIERLRQQARQPFNNPFGGGRGRGVIGNVIANLLGMSPNEPLLGGGGGGGGGGRVPPTGGGPPDVPPDNPDDDDDILSPLDAFEPDNNAEADWLGSLLSGHAGMAPEAAGRWSKRLRNAGGRFLKGAAIGSATHGAAAGTAGGLASMGFGVEAGVPLGNLAVDGFNAIANAPQWLQSADQGDVGRGVISAGASVGGAAVGMGVGAAIGGPVGAAIGGVLGEGFEKLVMWTEKLVEGLYTFAENINKSNAELAKYNGTIAASQMRLEMDRFRREFERGDAISGTAADLADAVGEMEEATAPFQHDLANVTNVIATMSADVVAMLGNIYSAVREPVVLLAALLNKVEEAGPAAQVAMKVLGGPLLGVILDVGKQIEKNTRKEGDKLPFGKQLADTILGGKPARDAAAEQRQPVNALWE